MKLFVWNNPYRVTYGGSCLYAIANTEEEARLIATKAATAPFGNLYSSGGELGECDALKGPPNRIHELPYAEIYEWYE